MEITIKHKEIKSLSELKSSLHNEILLRIYNLKWFDENGNLIDNGEYKYYNIESEDEFDLDYLIDKCDLNNYKRIDLMVEQLEENGFDLFEVLDEMISDYYSYSSENPNVFLKSFEFKLFSYEIN
jgi:hypothetical protein